MRARRSKASPWAATTWSSRDEPTDWIKSAEKEGKNNDLTYSGGFVAGNDGKITSVIWDSSAFNAGMTVGSELLGRERPQVRR